MKSFLMFDVDGVIRPLPMGGRVAVPPHGVAKMLRSIQQRGRHLLAANSGSSLEALRLTECALGFRFDDVAASHGTRHVRRGGYTPSERVLVPPDQHRFLGEITPELDRIREATGGKLYDYWTAYTMFFEPNSTAFNEAAEMVAELVSRSGGLLKSKAYVDGGVCVMPAAASKALLVDYLCGGLGRKILVGAGDTASDAPMLEAAEFPIVTRTWAGAPLDPVLVEIVRRKGQGYLARKDEAHGFGLMRGLAAAQNRGII